MELSYVQFELRACRNQYDGSVYYGVINTVADEQSKLGTKYTIPQIAFYKGIVSCLTLLKQPILHIQKLYIYQFVCCIKYMEKACSYI